MPRAPMKKYALAPDGKLVYRDTGTVARGNLSYKVAKNGQIRVYRNGKLDGYVGKPTKKVQAEINRKSAQRVKRAESKVRREFIGDIYDVSDLPTWEDVLDQAREWRSNEREGTRPIKTPDAMIRRYNFAEMLDKAVKAGVITAEDANQRWYDFEQEMRTGSKASQYQQWDDIKQYFEDMGFVYEDGEFRADVKKPRITEGDTIHIVGDEHGLHIRD